MAGFRMDEIMVGTHCLAGSPTPAPMHFNLTWGHPKLGIYLNPFDPEFLRARVSGHLTAAGLVHKADCTGSLDLRYFSERAIHYALDFTDAAGRPYCFRGSKQNIWPWNLHRSHTICHGTITDKQSATVVSRATVRFPISELPTFLRSFRLVPDDDPGWSDLADTPSFGSAPAACLTGQERRILAAMAGGIIPRGGVFAPGAEALADQWLPATQYTLGRMPRLTRLGFRGLLHLLNRLLPICLAGRLRPMTQLDEATRTRILSRLEHAGFPFALALMLIKVLVLPAFYGLAEVKAAIGYTERFENPYFERIKP